MTRVYKVGVQKGWRSYHIWKHTLFALKMLFSNVFLPTALLAAQAAAHGAVTSYVIDGVTYPG